MRVEPNDIIDIGNRKQLFIDDRFFARRHGMTLRVNPPTKAERVLHRETPWECSNIGLYSTVIEDQGVYKLWYDAIASDAPTPCNLCYATSADGVNWQREDVNVFDWQGHKENNIVMPGARGGVMIDPNATDEHRYKAVCVFEQTLWEEAGGVEQGEIFLSLQLLTSPDGIHWKRVRPAASPWFHDGQGVLLYDDRIGKYVCYMRTAEACGAEEGLYENTAGKSRYLSRKREKRPLGLPPPRSRTLGRIELDDPMQTPWPYRPAPPFHCVCHGQYDIATATDESDPPYSDLQTCPIVKYPWAEDVYIGLFTLYRHYPETKGRTLLNDGPNSVQLAVSRDGVNWQRPERTPYIPLGIMGEHDAGCIWPILGMIRRGNEIWQYYAGSSETHGHDDRDGGGIRLIRQRLDGFVSANAAYTGGEFTTPLLTFEGSRLELNLDCSAEGEVWVEILDEGNRPIEGYALAEAIPVDRNQIAAPVRWKDRDSVAELVGRPVRLHVKARAAKLYAFQFTGERG